jgi:hypothetical protein
MPARCASTMPWRSSACSGSRRVPPPPMAPTCAIRWPPCWPRSPRNRATGAASSSARRSAPCRRASGRCSPTKKLQSYRVLFFERRRDGGFRRPRSWPSHALGCVSTHDLPTLCGWWGGRDIEWRQEVGFIAPEDAEAERHDRAHQREASVGGARLAGPRIRKGRHRASWTPTRIVAVHRYVAMSPVRLLGVQLEDSIGETEQPNLPGASDPHPNWRRKLSVGLRSSPDIRCSALCAPPWPPKGRGRERPPRHLPAAVPRRLRLCRRGRHRRLSGAPGHQPRLRLAGVRRPRRLEPRLRRHRLQPARCLARRPGRLSSAWSRR